MRGSLTRIGTTTILGPRWQQSFPHVFPLLVSITTFRRRGPHLSCIQGVFLTALTHIQDGSKDYLPGNLVNFRKRQKTSEVIQDLQRWQAQPHNFHPLPSVLVYIDDSLRQFGDQDVSDVFWQLSMEREPKEREEEKLARILHESGFF